MYFALSFYLGVNAGIYLLDVVEGLSCTKVTNLILAGILKFLISYTHLFSFVFVVKRNIVVRISQMIDGLLLVCWLSLVLGYIVW